MSSDLEDAMARALAYTDAVGLSDGTDRPAGSVEELDDELSAELREIEDELEARALYREGRWIG